MNNKKLLITSYPIVVVLGVVLLCILILRLSGLLYLGSSFANEMKLGTVQTLLSIAAVFLIIRTGLLPKINIQTPIKEWTKYWWVATLPTALLGVINLLSVEWSKTAFDIASFAGWTFNNFSTGLFEELLLRGFCFAYLYRAWQHKKHGLLKAAIAQALIFGFAHLVNLQNSPAIDVYAQVIYATLLGIGFAGIVVFSKSLWPAIGLHSLINAAGDINPFFVEGYSREAPDPGTYIVALPLIFIISTLPGLFLILKAEKQAVTANEL